MIRLRPSARNDDIRYTEPNGPIIDTFPLVSAGHCQAPPGPKRLGSVTVAGRLITQNRAAPASGMSG